MVTASSLKRSDPGQARPGQDAAMPVRARHKVARQQAVEDCEGLACEAKFVV
ncbi:hypothetical protein K0M31_017703, partial [Melipona bicolor]